MIIDIVNSEGENALHVVDEAIGYQSDWFLPDMTASIVWNNFSLLD